MAELEDRRKSLRMSHGPRELDALDDYDYSHCHFFIPSSSRNISIPITLHETLCSIQFTISSVFTPSLTALNLTSDNVTLFVVSSWYLPAGFASIQDIGESLKLEELELGDSTKTGWRFNSARVALSQWCPSLEIFIYSADARRNWENLYWTAPRVPLPARLTVQVDGVRHIEKRMHEVPGRADYQDLVAIGEGGDFVWLESSSPGNQVLRETGRVAVRDVEIRSTASFAGSWWDDEDEESKEEQVVRATATVSTVSTGCGTNHAGENSRLGYGSQNSNKSSTPINMVQRNC
ncbi:hypothetical protein BKA70DRAFT_1405448 [Coprinopsis sp. MPI-PUGE-AT-0042]|nr:hypothetical protein BKA70DRAFT_1405448 [Coprinopsis sp. MPI-PUGE-AT-0042]